ncbi:hypothetical protein PhCBS80983_g02804 [Powellomyces hirtus]|uniref:Peroxisomal ATPase PEX6 n=1 Tax=Powellomyces hirtus TaxID=109895 RepID=A0A507E578_9FUNG|nr:hypothetical protein PhCBS80983_g02804 [Powellomyces hirtus]
MGPTIFKLAGSDGLESRDSDVLLVTEGLWNDLILQGARSAPGRKDIARLFASVHFTYASCATYGACFGQTERKSGVTSSSHFLVFVQKSTKTLKDGNSENEVHPDFFRRHGMVPPPTDEEIVADLVPCGFVELREVILDALDDKSYGRALKGAREIQNALTDQVTILRQLGVLRFPLGNDILSFRVITCQPVLQGTITKDTRVVFAAPGGATPGFECNDVDTSRLVFLIDSNIEEIPVSELEISSLYDKPDHVVNDVQGADAGESDSFEALPSTLKRAVPKSLMQPRPDAADDMDLAIWISYAVLTKLGIFSGSLAKVIGGDGLRSRLCRIFGCDLRASSSDLADIPRAFLSPSLHFNLGVSANQTIRITPNPIPYTKDFFPVAAEVTIARVAGRLTNDKKVLDECLTQLKLYFEDRERVVCENDIISVLVDEDRARIRRLLHSDGDEDVDLDDDLSELSPSGARQEVAHFKISGVRVHENESHKWKMSHGAVRIDPAITKIVQSGISHSRVPAGQRNFLLSDTTTLIPPPGVNDTYRDAMSLVSTSLHPISISLGLSCNILIHGPRGAGKRSIMYSIAEELGVHLLELNVYDIIGDTDAKTEAFLQGHFDKAAATAPCMLLLRHIDALAKRSSGAGDDGEEPPATTFIGRALQKATEVSKQSGHAIIVIGTTTDMDKVPVGLQSLFRHQFLCESPSEAMRLHVLSCLTNKVTLSPDVSLPVLAMQTAALVSRDLVDVVARAGHNARLRTCQELKSSGQNVSDDDLIKACIPVTSDDFIKAMDSVRASHSDSIGAPKIPNVKWDDVGGLSHVKDNIYDTIQLPLEHPELFASGMKKRSGILLYGPPGTGKTMVAKAVATNFALNFMSVKGPELLNMYIGESEANVRKVFQRARDARPCVVFFDELDSVAPKRGEKGDSGGVMDRIVSQLLAEIDGMGGGSDVFVIGATNRPDLLDPALLRPGRFDKLLYLGVSEDHDAQLNILQALTRKFRLHPDLDLRRVAEACPFHYTGADFYALCTDAMLKAIMRTIERVDAKIAALNASGPHEDHPHPITPPYYLEKLGTTDDTFVQVEEVDFQKALAELIPSVNPDELKRYKEIRRKFETDDEKKNSKGKAPAQDQPTFGQPTQALNGPRGITGPTTAISSSNEDLNKRSKGKAVAAVFPTSAKPTNALNGSSVTSEFTSTAIADALSSSEALSLAREARATGSGPHVSHPGANAVLVDSGIPTHNSIYAVTDDQASAPQVNSAANSKEHKQKPRNKGKGRQK